MSTTLCKDSHMADKLTRISPRIPERLVRALKQECKRDGRKLEGAIMVAIQEYLDRKKVAA